MLRAAGASAGDREWDGGGGRGVAGGGLRGGPGAAWHLALRPLARGPASRLGLPRRAAGPRLRGQGPVHLLLHLSDAGHENNSRYLAVQANLTN